MHGFLDTLRDGHPDTPLVLVSPLYCPIHEETPGPGTFDMDALGHVNNGRYVDYLQDARVDFLFRTAKELGADDLETGLLVARHEVQPFIAVIPSITLSVFKRLARAHGETRSLIAKAQKPS